MNIEMRTGCLFKDVGMKYFGLLFRIQFFMTVLGITTIAHCDKTALFLGQPRSTRNIQIKATASSFYRSVNTEE